MPTQLTNNAPEPDPPLYGRSARPSPLADRCAEGATYPDCLPAGPRDSRSSAAAFLAPPATVSISK